MAPTLLDRAKAWPDGGSWDVLEDLVVDLNNAYDAVSAIEGADATDLGFACRELLSKEIPLDLRAGLMLYRAIMSDVEEDEDAKTMDPKEFRRSLKEAKKVAIESKSCEKHMIEVDDMLHAIDRQLAWCDEFGDDKEETAATRRSSPTPKIQKKQTSGDVRGRAKIETLQKME